MTLWFDPENDSSKIPKPDAELISLENAKKKIKLKQFTCKI